ncbi:MAG: NADH-quinone oxidoreductase subunit N [Planctomycetes bacterium]|nr:NADH-quinone oxidoreductase subunit N [Planctomycetota bacterium]
MLAPTFLTGPAPLELALAPLVLVITACVVLAAALFRRGSEEERLVTLLVALGGCAMAFLALLQLLDRPGEAFAGEIQADNFGVYTGLLATVATGLVLLGVLGHTRRYGAGWGEALSLMLLSLAGILLVCMAGGLLALFLGIEILSVAAYGLTALTRRRGRSVEGALRYLILGAMASAFLLMGIAFAYGATGTTSIAALAPAQKLAHLDLTALELLALGFLLVGLGFKIGAVPFHTWVPDAYEGAPTPITGFMASAVKVAAFAAILRLVYTPLGTAHLAGLQNVLGVLAALTMVLGNLVALVQTNFKRMLAYSSIAHTGYMLLGVISPAGGPGAVLFYLAAYVPAVIGAFMVLVIIGRDTEDLEELGDLRGLAREHPALGLAMVVFMLSFIGVPVTGGFTAKLAVFSAAVDNGYVLLAVLGIVMSVVSVAYYLNVVRLMYIPAAQRSWYRGPARIGERAILATAVVVLLVLGLVPGEVLEGALDAARPLELLALK